MSGKDAYRGGRLEDMAPTGTEIPHDAGVPRTIRSVPRPDQMPGHPAYDAASLGAPTLAMGADNPQDIPRRNKDVSASGGVVTGTGDQLPTTAESKRMHFDPNNPAAKGHQRAEKHRTGHKSGGPDNWAGEGAEVDVPPGEEGLDQDTIRDSRKM